MEPKDLLVLSIKEILAPYLEIDLRPSTPGRQDVHVCPHIQKGVGGKLNG